MHVLVLKPPRARNSLTLDCLGFFGWLPEPQAYRSLGLQMPRLPGLSHAEAHINSLNIIFYKNQWHGKHVNKQGAVILKTAA